jgi:hypothetical protein
MCLATNAASIHVMSIALCGREIIGQRRQNRGIGMKTDKATKNYEYSGRERCTAVRPTVLASNLIPMCLSKVYASNRLSYSTETVKMQLTVLL